MGARWVGQSDVRRSTWWMAAKGRLGPQSPQMCVCVYCFPCLFGFIIGLVIVCVFVCIVCFTESTDACAHAV